jgi:hypothetical protein
MITTEEIATKVYQMLKNSNVASMITGTINYGRSDYTKEDIVIVPHTIDGEKSLRFGVVKVNIHVPDIARGATKNPTYTTDFKRIISIREEVIEVLKNHYEVGEGWNWTIGMLNPPIKEPNHNEHFVSLDLEITVRYKIKK